MYNAPVTNQAETQPGANATLVLQSHRVPLPHSWIQRCLDSVQAWAEGACYAWRFLDDSLFDVLTEDERVRCGNQLVVASDLARLRWCQRVLQEGYARVIWCDADTLVIDRDHIELPAQGCAFGRELWLQGEAAAPKLYRKIHNACMVFTAGDPVLDFYAFAATRLIANHAVNNSSTGTMVPQLAGPKFLTHLHNVVQFEVMEGAQVVSPLLAKSLLGGDGRVLQRYRSRWHCAPTLVNLCASEVVRGSLTDKEQDELITLLLDRGQDAFLS